MAKFFQFKGAYCHNCCYMEKLNYFDERYVPHDFEDVDLSTTALSLGMELIPLNNPGLQHIGGQSIGYSPAREAITRTNLKKFGDKWIK